MTIDQIGLICFGVMGALSGIYWTARAVVWLIAYMIQRYRLLGED